jgi:hypothetical protein
MAVDEVISDFPLESPLSRLSSSSSSRKPASQLESIGAFASPLSSPLNGLTPLSSTRSHWRPPFLDEDGGMDTVQWRSDMNTGDSNAYSTPDTRPSTALRRAEWAQCGASSPIRFDLHMTAISHLLTTLLL